MAQSLATQDRMSLLRQVNFSSSDTETKSAKEVIVVPSDGERGKAALQNLTPEQRKRLRAACRLLIDYLVDNAVLNCKNETSTNTSSVQATEPRVVQMRLEL
jgi:uncharacterized protein Smg (DUF494 family)